MTFEALKGNLNQIKEIVREMYVFTNQFQVIRNLEQNKNIAINLKEKRSLIPAQGYGQIKKLST